MTNALPMPTDLHKAADPAKEYALLDKQGQSAYMKRVDLMYPLYVEEIKRGSAAWTGRVSARLGLDAEDRHSKALVSSGVSIFKTFRLPAPLGLGYPRADLERTPLNRLRAIAGNHKWAMANPERVSQLLNPELKTTEYEVLAEIKGQTAENPDAGKFETVSFRFTTEDASMLRAVLQAYHTKLEYLEEPPLEGEGKVLDAKTLLRILGDWTICENPTGEVDPLGYDITYPNAQFLPEWATADAQEPQESDDDVEHAAD